MSSSVLSMPSRKVGVLDEFVLGSCSYSLLIAKKNQAVADYAAMQTIVATASMNPLVLMREVDAKKKRIIVRIDASVEGRAFLVNTIKETSDNSSLQVLYKRLRLSNVLLSQRALVGRELEVQKNGLSRLPLSDNVKLKSFVKFIDSKILLLNATSDSFASMTSGKESKLVFANRVLVDELEDLVTAVEEKIVL